MIQTELGNKAKVMEHSQKSRPNPAYSQQLPYHFGSRVDDLHLLKNRSSVLCDNNIAFGILNLNKTKKVNKCVFGRATRSSVPSAEEAMFSAQYMLTILSMPRGPSDVRTTSATAMQRKKLGTVVHSRRGETYPWQQRCWFA